MKKNKYKLKIENVQAIENAEIEIGNLTGIVGENNLGKSTINKILFCLVKASIELKTIDKTTELSTVVSSFFVEGLKNPSVKRIVSYIQGEKCDLNNVEMEIANNVGELFNGISNIRKEISFCNKLLLQLNLPLLRFNTTVGKIELFKNNELIYGVEISEDKKRFTERTVITGEKLGFTEYCNRLIELEYKDVTYLELNDILPLYSVWSDMLTSNSIKLSTKDTIAKMMKFGNNDTSQGDKLVYLAGNLVYKTQDKIMNINSIGDGFKKLAQLNALIENKIISDKVLLLLEEPEVGIHANKIKDMVEILLNLNKNGTDIVFTTHSSLFINYILNKANIHLAKSKMQTVLGCATNIKLTTDPNEILSQYIKPLTELREKKFESILKG